MSIPGLTASYPRQRPYLYKDAIADHHRLLSPDEPPAHKVHEGIPPLGAEDPAQPSQMADIVAEDREPARLDSTAEDQLPDLQSYCNSLEQQLSRRIQQRDYFKAKYQALATKFNKANFQDRGFPQLDDSYLVDLIHSLRTRIWKFAISQFGDARRRQVITPTTMLSRYMHPAVRREFRPEWYLDSPDHRPMIIEAFLWNLLVAKVSNGFWWAGDAGRTVVEIYAAMKPCKCPTRFVKHCAGWPFVGV